MHISAQLARPGSTRPFAGTRSRDRTTRRSPRSGIDGFVKPGLLQRRH